MKKRYVLFLIILIIGVSGVIIQVAIITPYRIQVDKDIKVQEINIAWNNSNFTQVIDLSDKFLKIYPDITNIILLKAFSEFNVAIFEKKEGSTLDKNILWQSIHNIRQALQLGVSSELKSAAYYVLGKNYYFLSDRYITQSIEYFKKALDYGYEADDLYEYLSSGLIITGNRTEAIEILLQVIKTKPYLSLYFALIDIYLENGNFTGINKLLEEVTPLIVSEQEKIALEIKLARVEIEKNNFEKAIVVLEGIIEKFPQSVEAHFYLGNIYQKKGDISKARYEWRRAYKMMPSWDKVIDKLDNTADL